MKQLKGKNAILTGGSMGLGPYIARSLAQEGVNLALSARSEDKLKAAARELEPYNIKVITVPADVTDDASRKNLVKTVKKEFGSIDFLINNAGVEWIAGFAEIAPEDIDKLIQTNLVATLMLTREVLPEMVERNSGHVVTISSLGGKKGQPYSSVYAATKAGVIAWNSSVRAELFGKDVSCSVVCPGFISQSGMFAVYGKKAPKISGESKPEKVGEAVVKAIRKDLQEVIINPNSIKPMMLLDAIHPQIMTSVFRKTGLHGFYHNQAEDNKRQ